MYIYMYVCICYEMINLVFDEISYSKRGRGRPLQL